MDHSRRNAGADGDAHSLPDRALAKDRLDNDVVVVDTPQSPAIGDPRLEPSLADRSDGEPRE
jgi:hypothetical protein